MRLRHLALIHQRLVQRLGALLADNEFHIVAEVGVCVCIVVVRMRMGLTMVVGVVLRLVRLGSDAIVRLVYRPYLCVLLIAAVVVATARCRAVAILVVPEVHAQNASTSIIT